jgi:hypothetical protein
VQIGESLPHRIQLDGQPAKEECDLQGLLPRTGLADHSHLLPIPANISTIEIFDHQGT